MPLIAPRSSVALDAKVLGKKRVNTLGGEREGTANKIKKSRKRLKGY